MAEETVADDDGLLGDVDPVEDVADDVEDVEPEPDDGGDEAAPEPEPQRQRASRGNERIRSLRERTRELEEAQSRREREYRADLERERQARMAAEEAARRREDEDEAGLSPEEKVYRYGQKLHRYQQEQDRKGEARIQAAEARMADASDRTSYEMRAASNPIFERYAKRVETKLQEMRSQGNNAPREAILRYLIGEDALKPGARKSSEKQKADAAVRVKDARGKPAGARGDVSSSAKERKSTLRQLEERLDGVNL